MCQLGSQLSKVVQLTRIKNGGLGAEPIAVYPLGNLIFVMFQQKIAILATFGSNFVPFWSNVKELTG